MPDRAELITYADRLGGDLRGLREVLEGPLAGLFGGVHVLPFFRPFDGADAGFDPEDHTEVDPRLGTWEDIAALAEGHSVMVDVIVNHVSSSSPQFLDWLAKGSASEFDGMFLTFGGAFPDGATRGGAAAHLPAPAGAAVHPVHAGRRQQAAGVDHVHPAAGGHRRAPSDRPGLPVAGARPAGRGRGAPGCGWTRWVTR